MRNSPQNVCQQFASRPAKSSIDAKCRLLSNSVSNGQTAQNGVTTAKPSFSQITRSPDWQFKPQIIAQQARGFLFPVFPEGASSFSGSTGSDALAQIWQCGCGLLAPSAPAVLEYLHVAHPIRSLPSA